MRQPFWIVNSLLLMLALIVGAFVYFSRPAIPAREDIEPTSYTEPKTSQSAKININKIVEDDLFDTYQKELIVQEPPGFVSPLPEAPTPLQVRVPEEPKAQFIEPLPITLKGIVIILTDDTKNRALIADNRSGREASYKVGDMIEDAQIIRIFSNKVILMRSNGQQEVLYLREKDAKRDPSYANLESWETIIMQEASDTYIINTAEFINRVQSLGQFVDLLELITAYKQGISIGCRVMHVGPGTLATALGLTSEDIIVSVNGISLAQTQARLEVFKNVSNLTNNDTIAVQLTRNNQPITLKYVLQEVRQARPQEIGLPPKAAITAQEQRKKLEQKKSFAPTLHELREREKTNMLENGKRPTHNVLSNLTE